MAISFLGLDHRIGKEQKAHSFDLFDAAATRRNARARTAAMFLARSSQGRGFIGYPKGRNRDIKLVN